MVASSTLVLRPLKYCTRLRGAQVSDALHALDKSLAAVRSSAITTDSSKSPADSPARDATRTCRKQASALSLPNGGQSGQSGARAWTPSSAAMTIAVRTCGKLHYGTTKHALPVPMGLSTQTKPLAQSAS